MNWEVKNRAVMYGTSGTESWVAAMELEDALSGEKMNFEPESEIHFRPSGAVAVASEAWPPQARAIFSTGV